ncbi:MAG: hypothetical protein LBF00_04295 [Mycoplasmataceae bacterium]|nr:hypothetical protein [Mycoplasmataceae bacterium]
MDKNKKLVTLWDYVIDYVWLFVSALGSALNMTAVAFGSINHIIFAIVIFSIFAALCLGFFGFSFFWYIPWWWHGTEHKVESLKSRRISMIHHSMFELTRIINLTIAVMIALIIPGLFLLLMLAYITISLFWILVGLVIFILLASIVILSILYHCGKKYWKWYRPKSLEPPPIDLS